MSTYAQLIASTESSRPVELYFFSVGTSEFRYSSSGSDVVVGLDTFSPEAITRGAIEQSNERSSATLQIRMPGDNAFVSLFAAVPPADTAVLTLYDIEPDETPTPVPIIIFKGYIQPVRFERDTKEAILTCRSVESSRSRKMPRMSFQGQCQNVLGDALCGANLTPHTHSGIVTDVDETVITVAGAAATGLNFKGGFCRPQSIVDPRMVIAQSGDDLTLLIPFAQSILGQVVDVVAGCDHLIDGDCGNTYDRVLEYMGFPWVPKREIFKTGID